MKIGIVSSGKLGFRTLTELSRRYQFEFVMTDSNSHDIIHFCQTEKIPYFKGNPRQGKGFEFIRQYPIDLLVSVNYLFIVEKDILSHPSLLSFNIHDSLLPKYRGRTPNVWAIINNEEYTGITAHIMDEGCDTGDILQQIKIKIEPEDTGGTLIEKFIVEYPAIVGNVIEDIRSGKYERIPQDNRKATYFGKRTPVDGLIDWNWQKERLNNWIRAQAFPYPGAYTFYENQKIIIDKIKLTDLGFHYNDENGKILSGQPLIIKTPNGAVEIITLRSESDPLPSFKTGGIFHK